MSKADLDATKLTAETLSADAAATVAVRSDGMTIPLRGVDGRGLVGLAPGARAGRYEIMGRLGAGAMGVVYEARDTELSRTVAVKLVRPRAHDSADAQAALRQEAQAMAQLSHPNVAAVFDIGLVDDQVFIAMELVRGHTLRDLVGADRPWRPVLQLALAAGRGLAAAHRAGVIHRDFKPDNVLVGTDGSVRVSDFGLARAAADPTGPTTVELAAHSAPLGTPAYMAPETVDGVADELTDQFALAVTMYELLEGERPFPGRSSPAQLRSSAPHTPRPWRRRDTPSEVRVAIERGFAADRTARWPSVDALCAAAERGARSHKRAWMTGLLASAAIIGTLIAVATDRMAPHDRPGVQQVSTFANAPQQQLTFSGDAIRPHLSGNSHLAYVVGRLFRGVIVHDLDTGDVAQVLDPADIAAIFLRWSPDGSHLLVGSPRATTVHLRDGTKLKRLDWAANAAWSWDGSEIEESHYMVPERLTRISAHTKTSVNYTLKIPGARLQDVFDWSVPDRVLLSVKTTGNVNEVWAAQPDGSHARKIYEDRQSVAVDARSWLFRGRSIYYERKRDQTTEIARLLLDDAEHVIDERVVFATPTIRGGFAISDDERSLIYARGEESSVVAVFSGGQRTVLLADSRAKYGLAISPDARRIAFIAAAGERAEIVIVPREGGTPKTFPLAKGVPHRLAWSPRSDRLAYTLTTDNDTRLWTLEISTSTTQQVQTSKLSVDGDIAWTSRDELIFHLDGDHDYGILAPGRLERTMLVPTKEASWVFGVVPSPDGRRVALRWSRGTTSGVWVISLDDGSARRVSSDGYVFPTGWTADGASVLIDNAILGAVHGDIIAADASGTGQSRVVVSPPPHQMGSVQTLPGDAGFATIEQQWRSDLWLVNIDQRRVVAASTLPKPAPLPAVMPELRNGDMTQGSPGSAPSDWSASVLPDEVAMMVDGCGDANNRCSTVSRGAALDQWIDATTYRGRRLRVNARVRAEGTGWIWVLAQTPYGITTTAKSLVASTTWTRLDVEADIPANASAIGIRLLSDPTSRAWFDDIAIERSAP